MKVVIEAQPYPICVNHSGDVRQGTQVIRSDGIEAACYRVSELITVIEAFSARGWWSNNKSTVCQQLTNLFDRH